MKVVALLCGFRRHRKYRKRQQLLVGSATVAFKSNFYDGNMNTNNKNNTNNNHVRCVRSFV